MAPFVFHFTNVTFGFGLNFTHLHAWFRPRALPSVWFCNRLTQLQSLLDFQSTTNGSSVSPSHALCQLFLSHSTCKRKSSWDKTQSRKKLLKHRQRYTRDNCFLHYEKNAITKFSLKSSLIDNYERLSLNHRYIISL